MKKEKIVLYLSTILALAIAILFYYQWNPENLLRKNTDPVTMADIAQKRTVSFTGSLAGSDIPRIFSTEDFANMLNSADYATAEPIGIVPTGVYTLKPWVNPYISHKRNQKRVTAGKRKTSVIRSRLNMQEDYLQYYLLQLPDESYILAQIPQDTADAISQGKHVTLPVSQKTGITDTARSYLADICDVYGVSMEGTLYAIDHTWHQENHFTLFILRFGAAAVIFFALAAALVSIGNKVLRAD